MIVDTMTGDNSDTTLTLSVAPVSENNVQVYFDGVYQSKANYSISGTTLTFSTAPATGVAVEAITHTQTTINEPAANTVTPTKIAAGDFYFDTNTLYIDSTNNRIGIGTSSPDAVLTTVNSGALTLDSNDGDHSGFGLLIEPSTLTTNTVNSAIGFAGSSGRKYAAIAMQTYADPDQNGLNFYVQTTASGSGATLTEAMRIDNDGNVGIGQASQSAVRLGVTAPAASYGAYINFPNGAYGMGMNATSGASNVFHYYFSNGTYVGQVYTTGSTTVWASASDYRLKENVVTDWDATTRLKQLKPSRFNFIKDADTTMDGFLAHEVQDIVPEAVVGEKDAVDADGNPKYQGIDQSKLVPLLVKTIQELEARITTLENA
jgi:hypothetical protein